jgi:NADPH:quinone reductase-like Zn-dependent oxidoreductase
LSSPLRGMVGEPTRRRHCALADFAVVGKISPTIAATYPFDHVAAAHSTKAGPGKTVLTVI